MGMISDIQRFSIADGPGIRTTVFFKGCNLKCAWCHNPETISFKQEMLSFETNGVKKEEICGREMTESQIFDIIKKDEAFYVKSGGGVTLSGGEPLMQADFCLKLLKLCKAEGYHTLIDTAGSVPFSGFEKVLELTDRFFYDLKLKDREDYLKYTGGDFDLVMANLKELIKRGAAVTLRIPVIPTVNGNTEYQEEMAKIIAETGAKEADLLPYHRLGSGKYRALGRTPGLETQPPSKELLEEIKEIYIKYGLAVKVEN